MTEHPEHVIALIDAAFGELTAAYREHLLSEIALNEPDVSAYGWFEFLPRPSRLGWASLDFGQRVVAYLAASERQAQAGR